MEASMVKSLSCAAAEWVTREAMQIHGGMGYAEEYAVSRMKNAELRVIPGVWGHFAGGGLNDVDTKFIDDALKELLAE